MDESRLLRTLRRVDDLGEAHPAFLDRLYEDAIVEIGLPGMARPIPRRVGRARPTFRLLRSKRTRWPLLLVAAFVGASVVAVLGVGGAPRPAPPFGLAQPGFIAFDTPEGVVLARGDGSDRHVLVPADGQAINATWSRDGLHLAFWHRRAQTGPWSLSVVDADGGHVRTLADGFALNADRLFRYNLTWSPDSRRIAFEGQLTGRDSASILVVGLDESGPTPITPANLAAETPAWSPDGSVIAFQTRGELHVVGPDGSNEHRLGSVPDVVGNGPDWTPDGVRLAVSAIVGTQADIFVISADGSTVVDVSGNPADERNPSWSPDGSRLAWARHPADDSARAWIVTADSEGGHQIEIREHADLAAPVWAPDGSQIFSYVLGPDNVFHQIVVLDPAGVAPVIRIPTEGNVGNGNWQRLP